MALKHHVEVKIGVSPQLPCTNVYYPKGRLQRAPKRRDGRRMYSRDFQASTSLSCFSDKDYGACSTKERINATSEKMTNISTVDGPTLEEEWLEAEKRGAAELARHYRSTALLMQQNGIGATNQNRTSPAVSRPIIYRKNDSHHKIEGSSIVNDRGRRKEWVGEGSNQLNTIVPSLLHSKSVSDKSEEGKGVCGFPCWKTTKAKKQKDQARRSNTAKPMFQ